MSNLSETKKKCLKIISLRSDYGGEFIKHQFENTFVMNNAYLITSHVLKLHNKTIL